MPTNVLRRVRRVAGEPDAAFLERAAEVARSLGPWARVETEMGPLCASCASFATTDRRSVVVSAVVGCYNCGGRDEAGK